MLCDSNIIIYSAEPEDLVSQPFVEQPSSCMASVSRVEVLGFPGWHLLDEPRRSKLETIVQSMTELPFDSEIAMRAVELRRQKNMKLGDAIIAATALEYGMPLVTRNAKDFQHIAGLTIIDPYTP